MVYALKTGRKKRGGKGISDSRVFEISANEAIPYFSYLYRVADNSDKSIFSWLRILPHVKTKHVDVHVKTKHVVEPVWTRLEYHLETKGFTACKTKPVDVHEKTKPVDVHVKSKHVEEPVWTRLDFTCLYGMSKFLTLFFL